MKLVVVLAVALVFGLARWYLGPDWRDALSADARQDPVPLESAECGEAEQVGDVVAGAVRITGGASEWADKLARNAGRRSYSSLRHQACQEKDE